MREQAMSEAERTALERELVALGATIQPLSRDLVPAVRARLLERAAARPFWLALAPAALALVAIVAGALLLRPGALSTAAEFIGLPGIAIFRGAEPTAAPGPTPLLQGTRVASIEEAARMAGFRPLVPSDPRLGTPDEIVVRLFAQGREVHLVYRARPGIPVSSFAGASVLITEVRGAVDETLLAKVLGPSARVELLTFNAGPAVWIEGAPHTFFYRDALGNPAEGSLRLAENVLLFERDGLLLRIESRLPRDEVLRIAATLR